MTTAAGGDIRLASGKLANVDSALRDDSSSVLGQEI